MYLLFFFVTRLCRQYRTNPFAHLRALAHTRVLFGARFLRLLLPSASLAKGDPALPRPVPGDRNSCDSFGALRVLRRARTATTDGHGVCGARNTISELPTRRRTRTGALSGAREATICRRERRGKDHRTLPCGRRSHHPLFLCASFVAGSGRHLLEDSLQLPVRGRSVVWVGRPPNGGCLNGRCPIWAGGSALYRLSAPFVFCEWQTSGLLWKLDFDLLLCWDVFSIVIEPSAPF